MVIYYNQKYDYMFEHQVLNNDIVKFIMNRAEKNQLSLAVD